MSDNKIISLVATIECYQKSQNTDDVPKNLTEVWKFLRNKKYIDKHGYWIDR